MAFYIVNEDITEELYDENPQNDAGTAVYDETNGTLTLENYNGGEISVLLDSDLTIILKGENVIIDNVVVSGNVNDNKESKKELNEHTVGGFISKVDGKDHNTSIKISNSVNNLNITMSCMNIGGFVGLSDCAKIYIEDCTNSGNIWM